MSDVGVDQLGTPELRLRLLGRFEITPAPAPSRCACRRARPPP
jgi:hypothetical protein